MSDEQMSQVKQIAFNIAKLAIKDVIKEIAIRWWRIGFLCGLIVGWLAGGMVMIWLQ